MSYRCFSKEFPEDFMICKPEQASMREMGSAMLLQAVIFIAKNVAGKFTGSTFGSLHPVYHPLSRTGKEDNLLTTGLTKARRSFSRISQTSSTQVPEDVKGDELKGGDDLATEAATMPATPSDDCQEV